MKQNKIKILKSAIIVVLLLLMILCFCASETKVSYAEETEGIETPDVEISNNDWTIYFKEKIAPNFILVVTAIGSIYLAIAPILGNVKKASDRFKNATEDVNAASNRTIENEKNVVNLSERLDKVNMTTSNTENISLENEKKVQNLAERLDRIERSINNTETITRIGFGNMEELVTKGYAREIAKVGRNESDKIKK